MIPPPSDDLTNGPHSAGRPPRTLPDPALLRLAQAVAELNPALARSLCLAGIAAIEDAADRESWCARLAPLLDEGPPFGAGPTLPA